MKLRIFLGVVVTLLFGAAVLVFFPEPQSNQTAAVEMRVRAMDVGFSAEEKVIWHHLDEGSGFIPLSFFHALRDNQTGQPFIEILPRFGLVKDPSSKFGLPVGLTVGRLEMAPTKSLLVGVSCSACHSGQFNFRGTALTIDGAPNMLNFQALLNSLNESVTATLLSPRKLLHLIYEIAKWERDLDGENDLLEMDPKTLEFLGQLTEAEAGHELHSVRQHLESTLHATYHSEDPDSHAVHAQTLTETLSDERHSPHRDHAHGVLNSLEEHKAFIQRRLSRLQVLDKAFSNSTDGGPGRADSFDAIWDLLVSPEDVSSMDAPVSIPHLFDYATFHWVHWDGNTSTVLGRDFAQAIALGADYVASTKECSVIPENVIALETVARKIQSPKWPEDVLGTIDREKVKLGETIYQQQCVRCHEKENVIALDEVQTDPLRERNFAEAKKNGSSYSEILTSLGDQIAAKSLHDNGISEEAIIAIERDPNPSWRITGGYITRALTGIWASPPYLHNGSVPTLWDLLQPSEQRPVSFLVGRELDPVKVGINSESQPDSEPWTYDTSIRGNSNQGHQYGVQLSDEEKWALIEYLKTL